MPTSDGDVIAPVNESANDEAESTITTSGWLDQMQSLLSDAIGTQELGDEESLERLNEAFRMTTFRGEADGQPDIPDGQGNSENEGLVSKRGFLMPEKAEHFRIGILAISWTSFFVLGGLGAVTFYMSLREHSNASFAFALDAFLVCASSIVLIWRYSTCGGKPTTFSFRRERISCLFLGCLFYISAIGVIARGLISLIKSENPEPSDLMWKVFIANMICSSCFAGVETYLAYGLRSVSIAMDAINTGLAAILSLSACINDLIFLNSSRNLWYIDAVIGIICGIVMIVYATWVMAHMIFHPKTDKDVKFSA